MKCMISWGAGRTLACAAVLLGASLAVNAAKADGAVAIGLPPDVAQQGLAVGVATSYASSETAGERALAECRAFQDAPESTRALCKVVATFKNECVVIALDPDPGTPGWGHGIAPSAEAAANTAMTNCRATAGADRVQACKVMLTRCDGQ